MNYKEHAISERISDIFHCLKMKDLPSRMRNLVNRRNARCSNLSFFIEWKCSGVWCLDIALLLFYRFLSVNRALELNALIEFCYILSIFIEHNWSGAELVRARQIQNSHFRREVLHRSAVGLRWSSASRAQTLLNSRGLGPWAQTNAIGLKKRPSGLKKTLSGLKKSPAGPAGPCQHYVFLKNRIG